MPKLVSICIPTYGRVEILKNSIESIFNSNVSSELYEICISDNSPTDETKDMLEHFFSGKTNIVYRKSTCEGFYNSIEALKLGSGLFLKLHNNYTMVNDRFEEFLNSVRCYDGKEAVLFFTFGSMKSNNLKMEYDSFDQFMYGINYLSTWSTSFGIWKCDFDRLISKVQVDKMFPHTSLLFKLTDKKKYIVDDGMYFENQTLNKKGGYNLPETFGVRFLGMCKKLLDEECISKKTYDKIKLEIFNFISEWFSNVKKYPQKYSFSFEKWEDIISSLYGKRAVYKIRWNCFYRSVRTKISSIVNIFHH